MGRSPPSSLDCDSGTRLFRGDFVCLIPIEISSHSVSPCFPPLRGIGLLCVPILCPFTSFLRRFLYLILGHNLLITLQVQLGFPRYVLTYFCVPFPEVLIRPDWCFGFTPVCMYEAPCDVGLALPHYSFIKYAVTSRYPT